MNRNTSRGLALLAAAALTLVPLGTARAAGPATLQGTLRDSSAAPVSGAEVWVYDLARQRSVGVALTDASGFWTTGLTNSGTFTVEFEWDGGAQWAYGKSTAATASTITAADNATVTVDDTFLDANRSAHMQGTLTDAATHAPVVGVCAQVYDAADLSNGYQEGCSDDQGHYDAKGKAGTYKVHFYDPSGAYQDSWYNAATSFDTATPVTMAANTVRSGLDASLARAGRIAGMVRDRATHVPLPNVCVSAYPGRSTSAFLPGGDVCTDSTGRYDVGGLPTGDYTVQAVTWDTVHVSQWLYGSSTQAAATLIHVVAGQTTAATPANLPIGGTITGIVTDRTTHAPIAGVCVGVGAFNFRNGDDGSGYQRACTDATGHYSLTGLDKGTYHVEFIDGSGSHGLTWLGNVHRTSSRTVTVALGKAVSANQSMAAAATVTGKVKSASGQPQVMAIDAYDPVTGDMVGAGDPDATGMYRMFGLPAGGVKVAAADFSPNVVWWPAAISFATATTVTTNAGKTHSGITFVTP
jgi:hypothetical protein